MALWDAADLLSRCKRLSLVPGVNEDMKDADWYALLTEAQAHWVPIFAVHVPRTQYTTPVELTSSDGGVTYELPEYPLGRPTLSDGRYGYVLPEGEYVLEGNVIRFPHGTPRTFSGGLFVRYIPSPGEIDGLATPALEPTLMPPQARILLVYHACALWASRGGMRDPAFYENLETNAAWDDPRTGKIGLITSLKANGGDDAYAEGVALAPWWLGNPDLGNLRHRLS